MGKSMMGRNSKSPPDVPLPSHAGVCTRAKTLALQKDAVSYIQLRSRRLIKPTPPKRQKQNRAPSKPATKHSYRRTTSSRVKVNPPNSSGTDKKEEIRYGSQNRDAEDLEASFDENMLETEGRERSTRETTPGNLIRDPETITTPGSCTKRNYLANANYSGQNSAPSHIPSTEMEDLFTQPDKQQQTLFIEKYNFDPVSEKPLPGRYEWVKMD